jgi:hypothetical protein
MMYVFGTVFCFCNKVPKNVSNLSLREATISTPLHSCQVARPRLDLSIRCSQQTRGIKVWHDANVRCVSMHAAFRKPLWNHRDQTSLRSVTWLWLWYIHTFTHSSGSLYLQLSELQPCHSLYELCDSVRRCICSSLEALCSVHAFHA